MTSVRQRHWPSYGTDPLPTPQEALGEPFAAFPSWFRRIECDRCHIRYSRLSVRRCQTGDSARHHQHCGAIRLQTAVQSSASSIRDAHAQR